MVTTAVAVAETGIKLNRKRKTSGGFYVMPLVDGVFRYVPANGLSEMISPVSCAHCGKAYDLTKVKVSHRFMDCTQFRTPCCGKLSDDREWKGCPDYKRIDLSQYTYVENI